MPVCCKSVFLNLILKKKKIFLPIFGNKNNFCVLLNKLWGGFVALSSSGCKPKQQEKKILSEIQELQILN